MGLQFKMSFVEEFTEQHLAKSITFSIIQQLQSCHSAVEDLIYNLESLREAPRMPLINSKIEQFTSFLSMKQELVGILQNSTQNSVVQWIVRYQITSPVVRDLLKQSENVVGEAVQRVTKRVFLQEESLQEFIEENQMISHCIASLRDMADCINSGKNIPRDKIKGIDSAYIAVQQKISRFQQKIVNFNSEMNGVVRQIEKFGNSMLEQFNTVMRRV